MNTLYNTADNNINETFYVYIITSEWNIISHYELLYIFIFAFEY